MLSRGAEWSLHEPGDHNSLPRASPLMVPSLEADTTTISRHWSHPDPETRATMHRITRIQRKLMDSQDRNYHEARNTLMALADRADTPWRLRQHAAALYRRAHIQGLAKGRSISSMVAACIYAAYRLGAHTRTLTELAEAMDVNPKELALTYRQLCTGLGLRPEKQLAENHTARLAEALHLTPEETRAAQNLLAEARRRKLTAGHHPRGLAAAAVYMATMNTRQEGHKISQKAIAEAAGVSEVTVRNQYKRLEKALPCFTIFTSLTVYQQIEG